MSRAVAIAIVVLVLYAASYAAFRQTHIEVWDRDQHAYVIFPQGIGSALYYLWRPFSYADGVVTGMPFHVGPHR